MTVTRQTNLACNFFKNMSTVKFARVIIVIKIIIISSYASQFVMSKPTIPKSHKSPEIWLASFQQTDSFEDVLADSQFRHSSDFENEFISKFNQTDYLIQEDTRQVVFACKAKYPVVWSTPQFKQVENLPFEIFKTDTVRGAEFFAEVPKNIYYRTMLTISFDGFIRDVFSVNFTCGIPNVKNQHRHSFTEYKSSSMHIFYAAFPQAIENFGETIHIQVPQKFAHSKLAIPCRTSSPTAPIKLEKEVLSETSANNYEVEKIWKEVSSFTFDPKYGFTLQQNIKQSVFGLYRCCISEQGDSCDKTKDDQLVYVNVTMETSKLPKATINDVMFDSTLILKGNSLLMYGDHIFGKNTMSRKFPTSRYYEPDLWCCSGVDNNLPVIYKRACINPLQCDILKKSMTLNVMSDTDKGYTYVSYRHSSSDPEDCISAEFYGENCVVFCKGENVQFGDYLIKLFHKYILPISKRKEQAEPPNIWSFEAESSEAAANISRRILLTVGHPIRNNKHNRYGEQCAQFMLSGETDYVEVSLDYWDDEDQHLRNTHIAFEKRMKTQYIAEYNRDYFYKGETLVPICLGWLSFYSRGAFVRIVFANGTSIVLNPKELESASKSMVCFDEGLKVAGERLDGNMVEYKIGKQVLAHEDMVALECWMPQWNTEKWDKLKLKLKVLEPTKSSFLWSDHENEMSVNFDLGKENQMLEWRILGGSPEPTVELKVDGKKIYSGDLKDMDEDYQSYREFYKFNLTMEKGNGTKLENDTTEITVVRLLFDQATHEIQGTYQCRVKNVGGTITQSYKVIVTDKRKMILVPIWVFAVSLLLIIVITGLSFKYWKQKLSQ